MNLIVYQMMQFQVMHVSDGYRTVEVFTGSTVAQTYLTVSGNRNSLPHGSVVSVLGQILHNFREKLLTVLAGEGLSGPGLTVCGSLLTLFLPLCTLCIVERKIYIIVGKIQRIHNVFLVCAIEDRGCHIEAQCLGSQGKVDLQDLSDIHTGRHAQRIQHDVQRTSVGQIRHIFYRKHAGNDTLVTMTTCHLIAYGDFSLLCDINADCLIYSGCQLIAVLTGKYLGIHYNTIFAMRYL